MLQPAKVCIYRRQNKSLFTYVFFLLLFGFRLWFWNCIGFYGSASMASDIKYQVLRVQSSKWNIWYCRNKQIFKCDCYVYSHFFSIFLSSLFLFGLFLSFVCLCTMCVHSKKIKRDLTIDFGCIGFFFFVFVSSGVSKYNIKIRFWWIIHFLLSIYT